MHHAKYTKKWIVSEYNKAAIIVGKAHYQAIKYAADHNWPVVLVFEDDAYPRRDAAEQI